MNKLTGLFSTMLLVTGFSSAKATPGNKLSQQAITEMVMEQYYTGFVKECDLSGPFKFYDKGNMDHGAACQSGVYDSRDGYLTFLGYYNIPDANSRADFERAIDTAYKTIAAKDKIVIDALAKVIREKNAKRTLVRCGSDSLDCVDPKDPTTLVSSWEDTGFRFLDDHTFIYMPFTDGKEQSHRDLILKSAVVNVTQIRIALDREIEYQQVAVKMRELKSGFQENTSQQ